MYSWCMFAVLTGAVMLISKSLRKIIYLWILNMMYSILLLSCTTWIEPLVEISIPLNEWTIAIVYGLGINGLLSLIVVKWILF